MTICILARRRDRSGVHQRGNSRPVELQELVSAEEVVSPVFRPIGQVCAVGTDRSGNQQGACTRVFGQVLAASLVGQAHTQCHQLQGLFFANAAPRKSLGCCLIARRDRDRGSGAEVIAVHALDELRLFQEVFGRPQGIVQIAAVRFQLGGKCAVHGQVRSGIQHAGELGVTGHYLGSKRFVRP